MRLIMVPLLILTVDFNHQWVNPNQDNQGIIRIEFNRGVTGIRASNIQYDPLIYKQVLFPKPKKTSGLIDVVLTDCISKRNVRMKDFLIGHILDYMPWIGRGPPNLIR